MRQGEMKLTCERIPWEVQWNTEQMGNHDEETTKQKEETKDNEMRNMKNEIGHRFPATPHEPTATLVLCLIKPLVYSKSRLSYFCS